MNSFLDRFKKKSPTAPASQSVKTEKKASDAVESAVAPKVQHHAVSPHRSSALGFSVLLHPLVTEKLTRLAKHQQAAFVVDPSTNKIQVKKAVEAIYGVKPLRVQMVNVKGKAVRFGRSNGKRSDWKKAIITLPAGTSMEVFHGVK